MNWDEVSAKVATLFDEVSAIVLRHHPAIQQQRRFEKGLGRRKYLAQASFLYDPDQQWYEDLMLELQVTPDGPPTVDRPRQQGSGSLSGDRVHFQIARGSGHVFAALEPEALPDERSTWRYEEAILEYVTRAYDLTRAQTHLILPCLGQPYFPSAEELRTLDPDERTARTVSST